MLIRINGFGEHVGELASSRRSGNALLILSFNDTFQADGFRLFSRIMIINMSILSSDG